MSLEMRQSVSHDPTGLAFAGDGQISRHTATIYIYFFFPKTFNYYYYILKRRKKKSLLYYTNTHTYTQCHAK